MKKLSLIGVLIVASIFAGCTLQPKEEATTQHPTTSPDSSPSTTILPMENSAEQAIEADAKKTYTLDDIALHKSKIDCWMSIEGKVYDLSSYTTQNKHPAGQSILKGCGTDATKLYNTLPTERGTHSQNARSMLEQYYIGDLEQ